jgi:hypothetical protein
MRHCKLRVTQIVSGLSEHAGCQAAYDIKITCFSRPLPAFKQAESMVLKYHYIGEYF